jgi:hypothetical protein
VADTLLVKRLKNHSVLYKERLRTFHSSPRIMILSHGNCAGLEMQLGCGSKKNVYKILQAIDVLKEVTWKSRRWGEEEGLWRSGRT